MRYKKSFRRGRRRARRGRARRISRRYRISRGGIRL